MDKMSGDWTDNWSGKDVTIPKDFKFGCIELSEAPQYTPVKPVDVVQCHFRKVEPEPQRSSTVTNEVASASVTATSPRQVPRRPQVPSEACLYLQNVLGILLLLLYILLFPSVGRHFYFIDHNVCS